ncbi:hypothetical protein [Nesterenkonia sp. K-15-9-6]|uniref:hypothetical protein n=1 Tax=Nesterenkonia sp. K-15-9-6 TaxID=3093918 RepID=UPI004043AFAE
MNQKHPSPEENLNQKGTTEVASAASDGDQSLLLAWDELAGHSADDDTPVGGADQHEDEPEETGEPTAGQPAREDPWEAITAAHGRAEDVDDQTRQARLAEVRDAREQRQRRWAELRANRAAATSEAASTPAGEASGNGTTPLAPYKDPRVAAEAEKEGPPEWLGNRWREIPVEQQPEAWIGLRRWVDWLVREYRLDVQIVPPCWYRHPDITAELWAAMNMEYKVWAEGAPSLSPMMMWHPNLQQMIVRLREMVGRFGCAGGSGHKEPKSLTPGLEPFEIAYDEEDWRRIALGRREVLSVPRPEEGRRYTRAVGFDAHGEQIVSSNLVGSAAPVTRWTPEARLRYGSVAGAEDSEIWLEISDAKGVETVMWESSPDGESWTPLEPGQPDQDGPDEPETETENVADDGESPEGDEGQGAAEAVPKPSI